MRWLVEGADATTGQDRRGRVDGHSAELAEQVARLHGLYVSSVRPADSRSDSRGPLPPAISYRLVEGRPPAALSGGEWGLVAGAVAIAALVIGALWALSNWVTARGL